MLCVGVCVVVVCGASVSVVSMVYAMCECEDVGNRECWL